MEKVDSGYFKGLTRKQYIEKVREIIDREGIEDISIRQIAKELGCSSAALYRYFSSKSELLYYANLNALEDYISRLNHAEKTWHNPWDIYVGVWDCYCKEAFRHPRAFNMLFFENNNVMLDGAIREYYQMFHENIKQTNNFMQDMLKNSDFLGRDYEMCKKCAEAGVLAEEDVGKLNRLACMLYKGYFKTVFDEGIQEKEIDARVRVFIGDMDMIVNMLAKDLKGYKGYYRRNK